MKTIDIKASNILRKGVAMIELIFALVIMGITLMSVPMLLTTASQSGIASLQQEAIAIASSDISMILTRDWDEGNTDQSSHPTVMVTAGHTDLNEFVDGSLPVASQQTGRRLGTPLSSSRVYVTSSGRVDATEKANFTTEGDFDDIDDFDGKATVLMTEQAADTGEGDIVDRAMKTTTDVSYASDSLATGTYRGTINSVKYHQPFTASTTTTNVKMVTLTLTTTSAVEEIKDKKIMLKAFSCNIGVYSLNERSF